jgi:hypothetical protein
MERRSFLKGASVGGLGALAAALLGKGRAAEVEAKGGVAEGENPEVRDLPVEKKAEEAELMTPEQWRRLHPSSSWNGGNCQDRVGASGVVWTEPSPALPSGYSYAPGSYYKQPTVTVTNVATKRGLSEAELGELEVLLGRAISSNARFNSREVTAVSYEKSLPGGGSIVRRHYNDGTVHDTPVITAPRLGG